MTKDVERFIGPVLEGEYDLIAMEHPPVMVVSDMLRSMITASPGQVLRVGDFAQIEARVLAWIAEQNDLLKLFEDGGLVYETMASYIFGVPVEEVTKDQRQVGKNTVLGCGYQMGAERYRTQAQEQTGVDIGQELSERAVKAYREKNSRIVQFWRDINEAAIQATMDPGEITTVGRRAGIRFVRKGSFLWAQLPSGRFLCYGKPEIRKVLAPWGRKKLTEGEPEYGEPLTERDYTHSLTYTGVDSLTKKWRRHTTYGGELCENVVQAMSRDLLAAAILRLEGRGYPVVKHSHDEIVTDVPEDVGDQDDFIRTMSVRPQWGGDIPIRAEGFCAYRYRK